jgi:hypothetical protein
MLQTSPHPATPTPLAGNAAVDAFFETMEELICVVEQETALVRAGKQGEAAPLEQRKRELAQRYTNAAQRINALNGTLPPPLVETIRDKHSLFQALLQTNLTVLATAHAVSEGIMRGVHSELARKAAPSTYGASGRTNLPGPSAAQPLAVSRVL